jgi:hypothetical protein
MQVGIQVSKQEQQQDSHQDHRGYPQYPQAFPDCEFFHHFSSTLAGESCSWGTPPGHLEMEA